MPRSRVHHVPTLGRLVLTHAEERTLLKAHRDGPLDYWNTPGGTRIPADNLTRSGAMKRMSEHEYALTLRGLLIARHLRGQA